MKFLSKTTIALLCFATMHLGAMDMDAIKYEAMVKRHKQEQLKQELIKAVQLNDYKKIAETIEQGADVNAFDQRTGFSALHIAVDRQNVIIAHKLLASGANPNLAANELLTPLHIVTQQRQINEKNMAIFRLLLNHNAKILTSSSGAFTPLHLAIINGSYPFIKMILEKSDEASVYALLTNKTGTSKSVLELAKQTGNQEIITYLKNQSLLHAAKNKNNNLVYQLLQDKTSVDYQDNQGMTVLHYAALANAPEVCTLLIDNGASLNVQNSDGLTPIELARNKNNMQAIKAITKKSKELSEILYNIILREKPNLTGIEKLLKQGANPNIKHGRNGETALIAAARNNNLLAVLLLLRYNASTSCVTNNGYTALHYAVINNNLAIIASLLKEKAPINAQTNDTKNTPIHCAILQKNLAIIETLLAHGANPNIVNNAGNSAFHLAFDNLTIIKLLTTTGDTEINFNFKLLTNKNGKTPLQLMRKHGKHANANWLSAQFYDYQLISFIKKGNIHRARFLIEAGVNPNAQDYLNNIPALFHALKAGHSKITKLLIAHGANIHHRNKNKSQPIHFAKTVEDAQLLLLKGADINSINKFNNTLLILACENNSTDLVKFLLNNKDKVNVNIVGQFNETALHIAIKKKNSVITKLLLQHKSDPNIVYKDTPILLHVVKNNQNSLALELLRAGADCNIFSNQGETPLHIAVKNKNIRLVNTLLWRKANPNAKNLTNGKTALHYAVESNKIDIVCLLCEYGANMHQKDNNDISPYQANTNQKIKNFFTQHQINLDKQLIIAIEKMDLRTVKNVLARGANVNRKQVSPDNLHFTVVDSESPLHRAIRTSFTSIVNILLQNNADPNAQCCANSSHLVNGTPLHYAAYYGNAYCITLLLKSGANINIKNVYGNTPAHYASNIHYLKQLIAAGTNINTINKNGETLLHTAIRYKRGNHIISFLLKQGLNIDAQDNNGNTPLHIAALFHCMRNTKTIQLLVNRRANLHIENNQGQTPLDIAYKKQHLRLALLLETAENNEHECNICLENKHPSKFTHLHCKHEYCSDCLTQQIKVAQKDHNIDYLKCPECKILAECCKATGGCKALAKCKALFIEKDVKKFSNNNGQIIESFQKVLFKFWQQSNQKNLKNCPRPDCKFLFMYGYGRKNIQCPLCKLTFCIKCLDQHKADITCEQAKKDKIKAQKEELETEKWKNENTKPCPKCTTAIEKNEGCKHMKCTRCQYHFCWDCGQEFIRNGQNANHNSYFNCNNKKINDWP